MAGVTVKIEDRSLTKRINALKQGVGDATPLMKRWGLLAHASILENFEVGGRPTQWKALAKSTIAWKQRHGAPMGPLRLRGFLQAIVWRAESNRVVLGTNPAAKDYAARQNFGWDGSGSRAGGLVKTPARKFMLLQEADKIEMGAMGQRYFQEIGT